MVLYWHMRTSAFNYFVKHTKLHNQEMIRAFIVDGTEGCGIKINYVKIIHL